MICKESETQEFLLDNALDDYDQLIWVNERETDQKLYRALPPWNIIIHAFIIDYKIIILLFRKLILCCLL